MTEQGQSQTEPAPVSKQPSSMLRGSQSSSVSAYQVSKDAVSSHSWVPWSRSITDQIDDKTKASDSWRVVAFRSIKSLGAHLHAGMYSCICQHLCPCVCKHTHRPACWLYATMHKHVLRGAVCLSCSCPCEPLYSDLYSLTQTPVEHKRTHLQALQSCTSF